MKSKKIKRIILIGFIVIIISVTLLYNFGKLNKFVNRYVNKKIEQDINISYEPIDTKSAATIDEQANGEENVNKEEKNKVMSVPDSTLKNQSTVSVIQSSRESAKEITSEEIREMVRKAIELAGGFEGIIKDNQVVVLKPNLVQKHVDSTGELFKKELNAITTDWRVTKAVVELVREYNPNGKVYVMEGSAGDKTKEVMTYMKYTPEYIKGVDEFTAIEEDSGGWQDFDSPNLVMHKLPDGLLHKEYYLNKKYYEADVLISIPCFKSNSGAVVTGGIKNVSIGATPANIYGVSSTNLSRTKMVSHKIVDGDLDKWIYDYYMCKPVDFVIIDGLEGFQNGPVPTGTKSVNSDKMNMRLILAGKDAVAVDTIEALIAGWDPLSITYLGYLNKSLKGNLDTSKITVVGNPVDEVRKDFSNKFPKLGGVRIPDKTKLTLEVKKHVLSNNKLDLTLEVDKKTSKVEVYIDDKLFKIVSDSDFSEISVDVASISKGSHSVKVMSHDRYLNHSEKKIEFSK